MTVLDSQGRRRGEEAIFDQRLKRQEESIVTYLKVSLNNLLYYLLSKHKGYETNNLRLAVGTRRLFLTRSSASKGKTNWKT
jgi:hypothetical protein